VDSAGDAGHEMGEEVRRSSLDPVTETDHAEVWQDIVRQLAVS